MSVSSVVYRVPHSVQACDRLRGRCRPTLRAIGAFVQEIWGNSLAVAQLSHTWIQKLGPKVRIEDESKLLRSGWMCMANQVGI